MNNPIRHLADYAKQVATGQKLMQGLNDGGQFADQWIADGANQLANAIFKGEVAPFYGGGTTISPPEVQSPTQAPDQAPTPAQQHAQANQIAMDAPVEQPVQVSNQISMDDYKIDKENVMHSEPTAANPEMEM